MRLRNYFPKILLLPCLFKNLVSRFCCVFSNEPLTGPGSQKSPEDMILRPLEVSKPNDSLSGGFETNMTFPHDPFISTPRQKSWTLPRLAMGIPSEYARSCFFRMPSLKKKKYSDKHQEPSIPGPSNGPSESRDGPKCVGSRKSGPPSKNRDQRLPAPMCESCEIGKGSEMCKCVSASLERVKTIRRVCHATVPPL